MDWMTATFLFDPEAFGPFMRELSFVTGLQLEAVEPRAFKGFAEGRLIHAWCDGEFVPFGTLCWGGESQRGRAMLDIPGASCGMVDWAAMREFVECLPESRLTRVDCAVDLHEGTYTVDDAVQWVRDGRFNVGGRNPSTRVDGDWLPALAGDGHGTHGRTLYVGKARNGKGLRVYEKGRQLGDPASEWVRFEVQFGNRDRVLPFDMLTDPGRYFVGSYPALELVLCAAGERIKTISNTAEITIGRILDWMRASAGKWVNVLADSGVPVAEFVDEIRVRAIPRRVQSSAVAAGLLPGAVRSGFEKWRGVSCLGKRFG